MLKLFPQLRCEKMKSSKKIERGVSKYEAFGN